MLKSMRSVMLTTILWFHQIKKSSNLTTTNGKRQLSASISWNRRMPLKSSSMKWTAWSLLTHHPVSQFSQKFKKNRLLSSTKESKLSTSLITADQHSSPPTLSTSRKRSSDNSTRSRLSCLIVLSTHSQRTWRILMRTSILLSLTWRTSSLKMTHNLNPVKLLTQSWKRESVPLSQDASKNQKLWSQTLSCIWSKLTSRCKKSRRLSWHSSNNLRPSLIRIKKNLKKQSRISKCRWLSVVTITTRSPQDKKMTWLPK